MIGFVLEMVMRFCEKNLPIFLFKFSQRKLRQCFADGRTVYCIINAGIMHMDRPTPKDEKFIMAALCKSRDGFSWGSPCSSECFLFASHKDARKYIAKAVSLEGANEPRVHTMQKVEGKTRICKAGIPLS